MLATSNVRGVDAAVRRVLWYGVTCHPADAGDEQCLRGVDAAVRRVLWYGVTCHPADAGDEQCLRCGCSSPSQCFVLLGRASRPIKRPVTYSMQVSVEPPLSVLNMTLPASAAARTPAAVVDRYLLPAPARSSKPAARRCRSTGQTDGRTDTRTLHTVRLTSQSYCRGYISC